MRGYLHATGVPREQLREWLNEPDSGSEFQMGAKQAARDALDGS
jgi:hypothetical protein